MGNPSGDVEVAEVGRQIIEKPGEGFQGGALGQFSESAYVGCEVSDHIKQKSKDRLEHGRGKTGKEQADRGNERKLQQDEINGGPDELVLRLEVAGQVIQGSPQPHAHEK